MGPPDKRSNAENALKQQLFLIPLSVSSVVGFGARGGDYRGGYLGSESQISEHQYLSDFVAKILGP